MPLAVLVPRAVIHYPCCRAHELAGINFRTLRLVVLVVLAVAARISELKHLLRLFLLLSRHHCATVSRPLTIGPSNHLLMTSPPHTYEATALTLSTLIPRPTSVIHPIYQLAGLHLLVSYQLIITFSIQRSPVSAYGFSRT